MSDPPNLTDIQHRAAIGRRHENLALRSGAGCGKTLVLVRRFTELLLAEGGAPEALSRFVALTFTEKAALEMAQRVREFLKATAAKAKGESRQRLLEWLEGLDEARISTIHSFCASLLRSGAIEAGIDPAFAVCSDELLTAQMTAEAAEQAVLEAVEQQDEGASRLLLDLSLDPLVDLVRQLIERRTAIELTAYDNPQATLSRWKDLADRQRRQAWQALQTDAEVGRQMEQLQAAASGVGDDDKLAVFIRDKLSLIRSVLADPAAAMPADFERIKVKPGNIGSPAAWGGKEAIKETRSRVKELDEAVGRFSLYAEPLGPPDEQAAGALAALSRLALRANELHSAAKRDRGLLDFTDLLESAEKLLRRQPDLCRSLSEGISQLLVDECQDTDAFQVRLLERLIRGGTESGAMPEGKIFLVGDAKQSIYRFRGAQVEVFQDWCRRLGPGRQEELSVSFRTHPGAAAFVNHLFAPMMGQDYAPIQAKRTECPPTPCVEILLADGVDGEPIEVAGQAVTAQAVATAERIEQILKDGERLVWDAAGQTWRAVRAGDIAILLARMTTSLEYERELARRDIPYYVVAGSGFFKQQEVYDVLNALRAIDNPFDDIALFGTLRSSLFGLDDNALLRLALAGQPPYWPALAGGELPDGLEASTRQALLLAAKTLGRLHRDKDALGIDRLIEEVLSASAYEATLLAQPQGRRMLGNVRMLLDQARAASQEGLALADFLVRMDELVLQESRYEQAAVAGEAEDVVRLMTIHKAKGLEFPVVVVPDLNFHRQGEKTPILCRSDWGLVFKSKTDPADDQDEENDDNEHPTDAKLPLSYRLAKEMENCDQDREDIRKLYVAITRAKDHVALIGANWRTTEGTFKDKDSFLDRIDKVLDIRAALEKGHGTIPYGDENFQASLRLVTPVAIDDNRPAKVKKAPGRKMLRAAKTAQDLTDRILASAPATSAALPLLGPLPAHVARAELAVTALADFAVCPMLYRWQHELRVPSELLTPARRPQPETRQPQHTSALDPATLGTLLHRCLELLDFVHPQPARALVTAAACQFHLEETADLDAVAQELSTMLDRLRAHPLWAQLTSAKAMLRELDFAMSVAHPGSGQATPAVLRGQIDLLYQDSSNAWHVVDYKSDRLEAETMAKSLEEHARRYELQVLAYAAAAARHIGQPPTEAALYFLRPGLMQSLPISQTSLAAAEQRLAEMAGELVTARRHKRFQRREGKYCSFCPYRPLCDRSKDADY